VPANGVSKSESFTSIPESQKSDTEREIIGRPKAAAVADKVDCDEVRSPSNGGVPVSY